MEDGDPHGSTQDDIVFNDDNLTWDDVARATRTKEGRFDIRARASSSTISTPKGRASSSKTMSILSLIDEDEEMA
ncbi:hypothetical protein CK203_038184 [Vitis vinifera]|uniref:Uncharacterized protein n=1 Tax=Vitis vinifera TaxID=29760 RepID=A0A438IBV9_VITVI|nr:hypothetical protein CK203_112615 [Vitis vinifera]RVW94169.1 hypothetical protein CK203_038184 [Vitis vinifera]